MNQSTHSSVANSTASNDRHGPRRVGCLRVTSCDEQEQDCRSDGAHAWSVAKGRRLRADDVESALEADVVVETDVENQADGIASADER